MQTRFEIRRDDHIQEISFAELEQGIFHGKIGCNSEVRVIDQANLGFKRLGQLPLYEQILRSPRALLYRRLRYPIMPIVTVLFSGICVRLYMLGWVPQINLWLHEIALNASTEILEQGQLYRLFLYGLVHTHFSHLLGNTLFFLYAAYQLEHLLGWRNMSVILLVGVYIGGLFSLIFSPLVPSLGASAGVFALMTAAVVLGVRVRQELPPQKRFLFGYALLPYLLYALFSSFLYEGVDLWGHLGGMCVGLILGILFDPLHSLHNKRVRGWLFAVSGGSLLLLFLFRAQCIPIQHQVDSYGWRSAYPVMWKKGWMPWGDAGWFSSSQQAGISSVTIVHPASKPSKQLLSFLLAQLKNVGKDVEIIAVEQHNNTVTLRLQLSISQEKYLLQGVVHQRGRYEHRLVFLQLQDANPVYTPLWQRLQKQAYVVEE